MYYLSAGIIIITLYAVIYKKAPMQSYCNNSVLSSLIFRIHSILFCCGICHTSVVKFCFHIKEINCDHGS